MSAQSPRKWTTLSTRPVLDYLFIKLREHERESPRHGKKGRFVSMELADWVQIIALTEKRELVLVEQFRHGTEQITLEFPAGVVNPGEDPRLAAMREMREETGYTSVQVHDMGFFYPNPAYQTNRCHVYFAENAVRTEEQELDEMEDIVIRTPPLSELPGMIESGAFSHGVALAALSRLMLFGRLSF